VILTALAALGRPTRGLPDGGRFGRDMEAGKRAGVKTCAVRYG